MSSHCSSRLAALALAGLPALAAAQLDIAGLSRDVDACTDFYQFANRKWLEATPIPEDRPAWGTFTMLREGNDRQVREMLAAAAREPRPAAGTAQRKVIEYYASGMDLAAIEKAGLDPLAPLFATIAEVKDAARLAGALARLQPAGIGAGFSFAVQADAKDSTKNIAYLRQSGLGLPDRDYYFNEDERSKRAREAYRSHVARALEWMGDETKKRALEKLDAMGVKIGYPDVWRDYKDADLGAYPFVENAMRAAAYDHRRALARLGKPVDRTQWGMSPHAVNAYASSQQNEIVFPAGILQPPFFSVTADDAVNYGGIGMVIGHEITHLFDDRGRRFDARGNLRDWWTKEDERRYVERAKMVEKQYSAYEGVEGAKLNGRLTLGENISDLGGLKIAYVALQKASKQKPAGPIEGLTPEQRFFISYAQTWRNTSRPAQERLLIQTDSHSPPRFRVLGPLSNMPEFARAFSCDAAKTLRAEGERVNIW